jgi:hypothetical protein
VPDYRAFVMGPDDHVIDRHDLTASDDEAAKKRVQELTELAEGYASSCGTSIARSRRSRRSTRVGPVDAHRANRLKQAVSTCAELCLVPAAAGLTMFNSDTIVHLIGDPCLKLYRAKGRGYWYFEYDDYELFGTKMVLVKQLNDLPLDTWVSKGKAFAAAMRAKHKR